MLRYMLGFEIRVREEAGTNGSESGIGRWKEDSSNVDNIARIDLAHKRAVGVDGELAWDMTNGNLICHFLNLDLLKRHELGRPCGKEKLPLGVIFLASIPRALGERRKLFRRDGLEHFIAASIASISIHFDRRLDIRDSRCDTSDRD
jgi:hypothetical protein